MRALSRWAVLIAAIALLAGCKAGSKETPNPAAAVASPTVVIENTAVTATEPTNTPELAQPTATPETKEIEVIGDDDFKVWAQRALELIETKAPEAFEEVMASINVIELVPAGSGMYAEEKRFAVGEQTAHGPGYTEEQALLWFAGTIVHDAHHSALYWRGEQYSGKEAEIACLTVQKAALELMSDDPYFANYVQGLIDGADDPSNQYWNQPNRHW